MKTIAFVSDIHFDEQFPIDQGVNAQQNWDKILESLHSKGIKEVVFGGDIGAASSHELFFDSLKAFSTHIILGNHDEFAEVSKHYNPCNQSNEIYYEMEDDHFKYLFMDSSSEKISQEQLNWLKTAVETNKSVLLFVHHPVLPVKTKIDEMYPLHNRSEVKAILNAAETDITIFCGHYHMNDEQQKGNIKQVITHAGSYQILKDAPEIAVSNSTFGYRIINIVGSKIESTEIVTL
ncbi:metallophosphoesterase family protein [Fulvivirga ligni]|uniref:metallophosphoesterase family protein n=1 Tax=Fulvivirga ligni TaxID=2904246 RepID=UPI001F1A4730|nr:metallophosphoesterase [Fulvivirga ligni]UII20101.1 metallophosphoesterase [Fulvivirga ligni]